MVCYWNVISSLIINWGYSIANGARTVNYAHAYSSFCDVVASVGDANSHVCSIGSTLTQAHFYPNSIENLIIAFIAIGS